MCFLYLSSLPFTKKTSIYCNKTMMQLPWQEKEKKDILNFISKLLCTSCYLDKILLWAAHWKLIMITSLTPHISLCFHFRPSTPAGSRHKRSKITLPSSCLWTKINTRPEKQISSGLFSHLLQSFQMFSSPLMPHSQNYAYIWPNDAPS